MLYSEACLNDTYNSCVLRIDSLLIDENCDLSFLLKGQICQLNRRYAEILDERIFDTLVLLSILDCRANFLGNLMPH